MRALVRAESWPIAGGFRIARGARTTAEVVVLELEAEGQIGRSECVPYGRYGESVQSVLQSIESVFEGLADPPTRETIHTTMPPGAARNAVDCALWDLEAKRTSRAVWELIGLSGEPSAVRTMRTVSVDSPEAMGEAAAKLAHATMLKVKVDGGPDLERIVAVREAAPRCALVIDANESWTEQQLTAWLPELEAIGVTVLEQPLPAGKDGALSTMRGVVPLCADESFHDRRSFSTVEGRYDIVNVKLDKTGGLTEALSTVREAEVRGVGAMVGCMVSTSLAVAPALLLAAQAEYVDLDAPLLLARDREGAMHESETSLLRASAAIWGGA
ncbi:MAG: dipeptide epimerase [Myxococcales bacterium]|nr:dipeptide epimerase [Myxococcales bacterium]